MGSDRLHDNLRSIMHTKLELKMPARTGKIQKEKSEKKIEKLWNDKTN